MYIHTATAISTGTSRGTGQVPHSWQEITGSVDAHPSPIHFHQRTGPAVPLLPTSTPIQFYEKLVDETVMGIIVQETNRSVQMTCCMCIN